MAQLNNECGQALGFPLPDWRPPPRPSPVVLEGASVRLEPLNAGRHAADLYAAMNLDTRGASWTYLPYGPFASLAAYREWIISSGLGPDPLFYAIVDKQPGQATGVASYQRIAPDAGSIEVGHIYLSPRLQRTRAATEAMYLMMRHAFELGYRRYEWKCDALNQASRQAAQRLGFVFEGIHRQATVYKGRNRDTAWYSVTDSEWPLLQGAFQQWLAPDNFDAAGRQRRALSTLTRTLKSAAENFSPRNPA